jgi:hypothetical protein
MPSSRRQFSRCQRAKDAQLIDRVFSVQRIALADQILRAGFAISGLDLLLFGQ